MQGYLLLFVSIVFLLFGIQRSSSLYGLADGKQGILTSSCSYSKTGLKKPCAKKCLKHQTHSIPKGAANVATDCNQQLYAVVTVPDSNKLHSFDVVRVTNVADIHQHLSSPYLEKEHAPPRIS